MDAEWLQVQFRLHPGKSKADLARMLGLEPPAISKILGGGRQIKAQEYLLMREFFGMPVDGEKTYAVKAPSGAPGGARGLSDRAGHAVYVPRAAGPGKAPGNLSEQLRVFRVEENLMEPEYNEGEHVLVDTTQKNPDSAGVFVLCDGYTYMIRDCAYVPGSNEGSIRVAARRKDFVPQTLSPSEFLVIGRVVGKILWT